ncbi:hypothetical protein, partial [Gemmatimonas sp.]|uniref:hypothetical protein n=1 Tax=Gemmatimonas sp. TaxID=1962908 RepID=UPI00286B1BA6
MATLLADELLDGLLLVERLWLLPCKHDVQMRVVNWVDLTVRELSRLIERFPRFSRPRSLRVDERIARRHSLEEKQQPVRISNPTG